MIESEKMDVNDSPMVFKFFFYIANLAMFFIFVAFEIKPPVK